MDYEQKMILKIESRINKKGLKKKFVAEKMGWHQSQLTKKLSGKGTVTANEMKKLCDLLGIEL